MKSLLHHEPEILQDPDYDSMLGQFHPDECKRRANRLPIRPRPMNPILAVRLSDYVFWCGCHVISSWTLKIHCRHQCLKSIRNAKVGACREPAKPLDIGVLG